MKQLAQMFIYEMSQMYVARGGQTVFSSIDLDMHVPEILKDVPIIGLRGSDAKGTYADYEDETQKLFNAFLEVYLKGDAQGKPFNFPKFEIQLNPRDMNGGGKYDETLFKISELAAKFGTPYYMIKQPYMPDFSCYQCCAYLMPLDKATDKDDMINGTVRGGSLQVVTVNLPQIAYESDKEEKRIYELIDKRFDIAKQVAYTKRTYRAKPKKQHASVLIADC
jgi:ribonucleoside-triphosphate reductase